MKRYLQPTQFMILTGLVLGVIASATVLETSPAFLGWALGVGLGLMGGAFVAAIASGDPLVSGPAPKRDSIASAPWLTASPDADADDVEGEGEDTGGDARERDVPGR